MEEKKLTEAGYRASYEYYNKLEDFHLRQAEEMRQKRLEILVQWRKATKLKENKYE